MAYSSGGLIQASDINGFLNNNTNKLNYVWGAGGGNQGYGQTEITAVSVGDIVVASPWTNLINHIKNMASHQGTSITSRTTPATGDLISFMSNIDADIGSLTTNRLNAASQGGTSSSTATTSAAWSDAATFTLSAAFTSYNNARYFFNAGGQLSVAMSHSSSTNINGLIQRICSHLGTLWLSSGSCTLAGTSYTGTTQFSGGGSSTITTGTSFYNTGTMAVIKDTTAYTGGGDGGTGPNPDTTNYTDSTAMTVSVAISGGTVTITVVLDEVPNGAVVADGTSATITSRPPSTTYLTNSWSGPTLSSSVTQS